MVQVTRKDDREGLENLLRRFNRKVQQSGKLGEAKRRQYFDKPASKQVQREAAIRKKQRKESKMRKIYLGR